MVESDEEQLEVLKKWWDENGTSLIVTVVISLGVVFGYRAWETGVRESGEAASDAYQNLVTATSMVIPGAEDEALLATATSLGETLKNDHEDSTYAVFAALHLARIAVDGEDLEKAEQELRWALGKVDEPHLETLVRMRLARVLMAMEDSAGAMSLMLAHQPPSGQEASWHETLGDVYLAVGDQTQARDAYQTALNNLLPGMNKTLLELKLSDIPVQGGVPVAAADADAAPESAPDAETTSEDDA